MREVKSHPLCSFFLALAMLPCLLLPVFQKADRVDAADVSNITIQMHDLQTGVAIKGGSLVVYQVAKKDSAGKFQYTSQFSSVTKSISSLSQDQIMTADFANTLASYVTANQGKLSGVSAQISDSGEASVNVEGDAVYLVTQDTAASGYEKMNPFCVVLPYTVDGKSMSNIIAQPKMKKKITSLPKYPTTPTTPSSNKTPSTPSTSKKVKSNPRHPAVPTIKENKKTPSATNRVVKSLPQTGQLNWPIPLLALLGLTFFTWGWAAQESSER
ncbi:Putative uncharacterized protein [Lactobacillus equicursoris DSM 19284 = JCM 14600 = CIP 110162]|uniref:Gram-positive pilin subunit D1 N-terminal domain-containing protein n=1 Tax=Lactobacillus equicursoris DSM 19284 = JCM 14600 = CIP 110162 TaxID=1293597 RepID=K0NXR5_9LACO|nr:hypothetical protein [Lactobacillus equicursoris]KRL02631.1 hypothetical protein FC20_GL000190 [Lactobacillus equicursoris DSM 19284 = JCM 14600 = CIP 110162]CCK85966.1 Putative uncharacterized protein [Lactobacillus equicursoris DSM 19284 = JCM 14600 = CIP 110162]